jgi:hypothetical protein
MALNELASAWTRADSAGRQAITTATRALDQSLRVNPQGQGESRSRNRRIIFQPPLGVIVEVHPQRSVVNVLHVWTFRRRR